MQTRKIKVNPKKLLTRGLLCVLILYIFILFVSQQFSFARLAKEEKGYDKQIEEAQKVHDVLEAEKEASSSPEVVERVARDKLGFMKPNEKVFIDSKK
ncbi:MAG: septum formation initiator family protein [Ruminococcaceae bacterium]|nr:septum formation initiator family protein [Oscillospiraceae bacterium]